MITNADSLLATMWPLIRQNLQKAGKLVPVVFIRDPKGLQTLGIDPASLVEGVERAAVTATIRDRVAAQKATLVMLVAEVWAAPVTAVEVNIAQMGGDILRASARENRQEVLTVNVQTPDSTVSGTTPIIRGADGKPDVSAVPPELHPAQSSMRFF